LLAVTDAGRALRVGFFRRLQKAASSFVSPNSYGSVFQSLGGGAKLWEWAANPLGSIFVLLLRKSTATGGGDYCDPLAPRPRMIELDTSSDEQAQESFVAAIMQSVAAEGRPIELPSDSIVGRWAEESVVLVGDYDESKLWDELPAYRNISKELAEAWNSFIEIEEMKLAFNPECSCQQKA
jgi:hypothetical protein